MKKLTILVLMALLVTVGFVLPSARMVSAAPAAPTLVSPANDGTVTGASVTFEWVSAAGATDYKLMVNTTNNLYAAGRKTELMVGNVTTYSDSGYPANGTKYYWWVVGYAADGSHSLYSDVIANGFNFTNMPMAAPTLVSPANGAWVSGTSVNFEWGSAVGAVKYKLLVSTSTNILDATKYKCNVDLVGEATNTYVDTGYSANTTKHYWWVWAYAADGSQSEWAQVTANGRWFSTPAATATITITPPSAIAFGTLSYASFNEKAATSGRVTMTPGSSGVISWTVTAQGTTGIKPGYMVTGSTNLTDPLLIGYTLAAPGPTATPTLWTAANGVAIPEGLLGSGPILAGPLTYSGVADTGNLDFCARQYLESGDTTTGAYSCAITFTATCLP